ncbi:hypothetical protein [Pelagibaculum spongiae]|uniref:Tle cognate immunity protein 4 C-terminal domain-containing protein n=1 Tax=Pelagibaculum spongiae TaxID=2080658 RepID=A0A2V1H010_9GAMM|nr:hypothetical protein [Pelagibaculum spongiae]PVZ72019.1 hypothetical protein DC094_03085 [Pelagibaculum spongiae]
MIRLIFLLSAALLSACSIIGSTRTAMIDEILEPNIFEPVCIGRYQMDLPKGYELADMTFKSHNLLGSFIEETSKTSQHSGLLFGQYRVENWKRWVHNKTKEYDYWKPSFVYEKKENGYQIISTHFVMDEKTDPVDMLSTYIYKDLPTLKQGIGLIGSEDETIYIRKETPYYKHFYDRFLEPIPGVVSLYKHLPWPHNQLGVCLTKDITFNTARAAEDEYLRVIYRFREKTFFQFYIQAYARDQHTELHDEISSKLGALSLFASDYFNFGGRTGKLFLSGDVYSPTATRFRWYATDAVAGSTQKPFISIEGRVDINDFPELKGLNNIDSNAIALSLLASFQPRENGLVGTR